MSNLMSSLVWSGTMPTGAVFDPATLSLDGWWRANFASPWTPTASAGTSGSNGNLSNGVTPPSTGSAVNGLTPATCNGSTQFLNLATAAVTDLVTSTAATYIVLMKASASTAATSNFYDDPGLGVASSGNAGLVFTSSGVRFGVFDTATRQTASIALSTGVWAMCVGRVDSGNVKCRVASGGSTTDATPVAIPGTAATLGADFFVGKNYAGAKFFAGDILEVITSKSALSDADLVNVKSYFNNRYALSL